ncbi:MAG: c-type cytochrome [Magnetovibrio sp.]|nr:c-type cytochrome [Magnetovibrio sp.]
MEVGLDQFWASGLLAIFIGMAVLVMLVQKDLVPLGPDQDHSDTSGRWLLGAALGIGIIAFSIKLLVVYLFTNFPEQTISPLLTNIGKATVPVTSQPSASLAVLAADSNKHKFSWLSLPDTPPFPQNNPTTNDKIALGKLLFNDQRLSKDGTISCASCHDLADHGGADGRPVAQGTGGAQGTRNTPSVINAGFQARLFWDGRASSLEQQAIGPLLNPIEMGMPSTQSVVDQVTRAPSYLPLFKNAFGPQARITIHNITKAIAAYERSLTTNDTPYDRFVNGDTSALTPAQKKGMYLFQKLGCKVCHAGPNFSGASLVGPRRPFAHLRTDRLDKDTQNNLSQDKGRSSINSQHGLWRIPSLRNVALTAPYFHNGSVKSLRTAVEIMAHSQLNAVVGIPSSTTKIEILNWSSDKRQFYLSKRKHIRDQDISNIVDFLHALTSERLKSQLN